MPKRQVYIFLLFIFGMIEAFSQVDTCETMYHLTIHHPGISQTEKVPFVLFQDHCSDTPHFAFYANVQTVVCGDTQCRIDTIRLYWDEFGFFQKIELPEGLHLEKAEGTSFTYEDYHKLDQILANKTASIREIVKEDLIGTQAGEGYDAISRASMSLDKREYVQGAIWTTYTLWHWANGEIVMHIRKITSEHISDAELRALIDHPSIVYQRFAIEQMIRKKMYDTQSIHAIQGLSHSFDFTLQRLLITYAEGCPVEAFCKIMIHCMSNDDRDFRILCLTSIRQTSHRPPLSFYESLSQLVSPSQHYPVINLWLETLTEHDIVSNAILDDLLALLGSTDFIVARRAYWYLQRQTLPLDAQKKLADFSQKYANKL